MALFHYGDQNRMLVQAIKLLIIQLIALFLYGGHYKILVHPIIKQIKLIIKHIMEVSLFGGPHLTQVFP